MADKVKLGIIGYGHIGSQHGRAIRDGKCPQVNLTAVCDIDPARLELAKKTNGEDIQTFTDASELIHSGACEAVIIAVPHYLHPSMAIEAMETGLHILLKSLNPAFGAADLSQKDAGHGVLQSVVLAVVGGLQRAKPRNLNVKVHLFFDHRVSGSQRLYLSVGERSLV